ncbi:hypothetical protein B0T10DRAFT_36862 [Thelonectria olida]|uniref:Uncharacterized protein n=1 Tax=Thelonectria olida TaxID=1576542 RepID=A0A9P9AUC2_9HYPO|nr:hypothetical protein B0T10DRAFT_36862 [Thelonectria olida]
MRGKNTRRSRRTKELARSSGQGAQEDEHQQKPSAPGQHVPWVLTSPQKIASELSLFDYADDMKPYMLDLVHRAFTLVKPSTYTVEIVLVDGPRSDMFCFSDFSRYPGLLHAILFTSQAFYDLSLGLPYGKIAQLHLAKTLYHLQRSLSDKNEATADSTLTVVLSLATAAAILGDLETVKKHMSGVCRMIELRGGIKTIERGSMIEHKARRIDFGLALSTGQNLNFLQENISWDPQVAHGIDVTRLSELRMLNPPPDPRLLNIWADLRVFTRAANEATKTGVKMPPDFFSRVSSSVPFRLLALQFDPTSLPELLRLCMLAYMKSVLIQIDGLGPQIKHLADCLKGALLAHQLPPAPEFAKFFLWAFLVSTLSIFENLDQDWLRVAMVETAKSLSCRTWAETRVILKEFLWIDMIHNQRGKQIFDRWLDPGRSSSGL